MSGLWTALQFLTRLPVPPAQHNADDRQPSVVWLPIVGCVLGGLLVAADVGLSWLALPPTVASTLLVVWLLALTGALHADGLMDTCDAVFCHASPDRRLAIMRDTHVGSFGVVGLVCVVVLKIAAVGALPGPVRLQALVLAPTLGRWAIVLLAGVFPYGRPSGLGAPLKQSATPRAVAVASAIPALGCLALGPTGLGLGLVAGVATLAMGGWLMRLLPGLTGDCYGAACEVVEALVWLSAAPLARGLGPS